MELPAVVQSWEPVTRYLNSDHQIRKDDNTPKHQVFEPRRNVEPLSLSVFRICGLNDGEIWNIGESVFKTSQNPNLHGRADILVSAIKHEGLGIDADNNPYRHANIVNWPNDKDKCKLISLELASKAKLHIKT